MNKRNKLSNALVVIVMMIGVLWPDFHMWCWCNY